MRAIKTHRLVFPEIPKPAGRQLRISDRVLNILVAKIKLDRPRILASVRKIKARRVPQHVRMDWKLDPRRLRGFGNDVMDRAPRHRPAS